MDGSRATHTIKQALFNELAALNFFFIVPSEYEKLV
jgi:hypothetical protein